MTEIARVALAARVFTIAALISVAAVAGTAYLTGALLLVAIATLAIVASHVTRTPQWLIALGEGVVTAVVAVTAPATGGAVVPYLVVPALVAALDLGFTGLLRVVVAEFVVLALARWISVGHVGREFAGTLITWLATAIGIGLMAVALRRAVTSSGAEGSYRSAVALIRRLEALTGKLSGGLDAVDIAEQIMDEAAVAVPSRQAVVFVPSAAGTPVPLRCTVTNAPDPVSWATDLADRSWQGGDALLDGTLAALPLTVDHEVVGSLVLDALRPLEPEAVAVLQQRLEPLALQLQAALLFGRVRDAATSQERQRIAREVHDGVAQDIASLGYLVDNLADAAEPGHAERVSQLRAELTRVVTELRHSIFDLRQVVPADIGLGESLSAYARQIGASSDLTVHVALEESGSRLSEAAEHELLRIAQEAMNNTRKHSAAKNLWLCCTVRAPYARIEVLDDGRLPHQPTGDSHGLDIMRERAESIGARLTLEEPSADHGTRVTVSLGAPTG